METTIKVDKGPEEVYPGDDVSAIVASVLDDICQKVVMGAEQMRPVEPNIEYDELSYRSNSSPDIDTDIDVERGCVTPSTYHISKADTVELKNGDNGKDVDSEKRPLSYELEQGNRILKEIMSEANKSVNWAFTEAVDAEKMGLYDYYDRIKKPMWLRKSE